MSGSSYNPQEDLLNWLKTHLPEVFKEGKIDCDILKKTLGETVSNENERYGLTWAGKSNCFRVIQEPTTATLKPVREESVNFDETENVFIEGDNLEVLKVLQKPYYGKVKMIYIDPPYNTGNDFIYNDNFKTSRREYLEEAGETDENGNLRSDGLMKNSKDHGHYHSDWLNMMYPRLFLARNLLREDGVIFVSIDDNEVKNLRAIMDEIFGEDNFIEQIVWKNKYGSGALTKGFASVHEYILCFSKTPLLNIEAPLSEEAIKKYSKRDEKFDIRGGYITQPLETTSKDPRPNLVYPIYHQGHEILPKKQWIWSEKRFKEAYENDEIVINETNGKFSVRTKQYLKDENGVMRSAKPISIMTGPYNQEGTKDLRGLGLERVFDFPKPVSLIKYLLSFTVDGSQEKDSIILDFFAGSGTTAHAVMTLNAEDGGNRKCISVQLPELCDEKSEAYKAGFKTIAEISKERMRRAGKQIEETVSEKRGHLNGLREVYGYKNREISEVQGDMDAPAFDFDFGFKVFRLEASNFKVWESQMKNAEKLAEQMDIFVDNNKGKTDQEAVLYELTVKSGLSLNAKVENKGRFYSINNGELVVCLSDTIDKALVDEILAAKPTKVLCLDSSFGGNDQLKTNTALQMESAGIELKVI